MSNKTSTTSDKVEKNQQAEFKGDENLANLENNLCYQLGVKRSHSTIKCEQQENSE